MSFDSLLNKTCSIMRRTVTGTDSWNQPTYTTATVATPKCTIQPRSSRETEWDRLGVVYTHEMYLREPSVGLLATDLVVCGGITYSVEAVTDGAGRDHHLEVALKRVV